MERQIASTTREAVLDELTERLEGRHPSCQTITEKFIRDPEFQQASQLLAKAIQAERHHRRTTIVNPPPGWLLPG
jgi:hypothetical protein